MSASGEQAWLAWQIVDSAFPTGAFVHSFGLEAAWQQGEVADASALVQLLRDVVQQAAYGSLPLVNAAYRAPHRWEELDTLADAFLTNPVANRASRGQGRTLLTTASRVWPSDRLEAVTKTASGLCAHSGPVSGVVFRALDLPLATVQRTVLFSAARGVLSAAVRLGIAGSYEAQRLQYECGPWLETHARRCAGLDERDLAQTVPLLDLLQAGQDRLYSRLFQS